ncbi:MAG: IS5 family transposase [Patescibacteria group bacterium]
MTVVSKKEKKRWGKKFIDRRNWCECNEHLVKRGEYFIALDFVEGWKNELSVMNRNKVGAKFVFPKTLIELQALWHANQLSFRMIEGMTREMVKLGQLPEYNDYSTANRRINTLDFSLAQPAGKSIVVFGDGTGLQAVNGGEYLREKYGKKNRRWIQIVLLGDVTNHEPVSFEIRSIPGSEPESIEQQIENLLSNGTQIAAAGGDGAMDSKNFWNFLNRNNINPIIKPDKNALDNTDCASRNSEVKLRNKIGYKKWSKKRRYGHRWPATEGIFSAVKRIFGEQLLAKSEKGMLQEAASKIWAYQRLKRYGEN